MWRLAVFSFVLAALFLVGWLLHPISEAELADAMPAGGWRPVAFIAVATVLSCLLLLPGAVLAAVSGALFGAWSGSLVTIIVCVLSAAASRELGARGGSAPFRTVGGQVQRAAELAREHGLWAVITQRLLPLVPDGPCSYAFGVAGVGAGAVVLGTLIGSTPRAIAYTMLGDTINHPFSGAGILAIGVVVVSGAAGLLLAARARRAASRRT